MNILLLNISIGKGGWGGIESHSDILASTLVKRGHNVIMGCQVNGFITTEAAKVKIPARRVRVINSGDILAIIKMIRISSKENIELIIANHGREYWPAALAAKFSGARIVFVRHQTDRLKGTTCLLVNRFVDRVIAVSGAVKNVLIESGVLPEKVEIIFNSISPVRFDPSIIDRGLVRKELGIRENDIVVGTVGKLHAGKGGFELINAVSRLTSRYPTLKLLFVGEGPELPALQHEARSLLLDEKVLFAGLRKDTEQMYAAMDIFVLASHNEGLPTVLVEAMAMGKPVIVTPVGGIPEVVSNEVSGLLVPQKDPVAIANAISRYIDNAEFSRKVAAEGRRVVEHKFSDKIMGDKFEAVFNGLPGRG